MYFITGPIYSQSFFVAHVTVTSASCAELSRTVICITMLSPSCRGLVSSSLTAFALALFSLLTDHVTVSVQGQNALARVWRGRNAWHMPPRDALAGAARSAGCVRIRVALLHGILAWSRHRRRSRVSLTTSASSPAVLSAA